MVRQGDIQGTTKETVRYKPEHANRFNAENAKRILSQPTQREIAPTESLLEKMLPTLIKMERPKLPVFDGNPIDYAIFKACIHVDIKRKGVYYNGENSS